MGAGSSLQKGHRYPGEITGKFAGYASVRRRVLHSVEHRQSKRLNNRAENSRQPTRARERAMK